MNLRNFMGAALVLALPGAAFAQQDKLSPVSFDLQDAPVRSVLEAAFKQAGINNYLIDNNVVGFVTLKITEQPFESALKLVMRAASVPLTYSKENDVWIVKPRTLTPPSVSPSAPELPAVATRNAASYERISLTYLDAADLSAVLGGITMIHSFTRQSSSQNAAGAGGPGGFGGQQGGGSFGGGQTGFGAGLGGQLGGGGFGGFGR